MYEFSIRPWPFEGSLRWLALKSGVLSTVSYCMNLDPALPGNFRASGPFSRFSFQPLKSSLCMCKEISFSLRSMAVLIGRAK